MKDFEMIFLKRIQFDEIMDILKKIVSHLPDIVEDSEGKLNQTEAAEFLEITEATLIAWKKKKLVPYEQLIGTRKVVFYKSQLKSVRRQNPTLFQPSRK